MTGPAPADLGSPVGSLSLAQLAERIAHEKELREMTLKYEAVLRERSDVHERETRELVTRLEDHARTLDRERIEERLTVLNNERARQEADRGTFATKTESDLAFSALGRSSTLALKELGEQVTTLREQRERDLGRQSGSSGVTSWLAPNLGSVMALIFGAITLYLLLVR